jgi:argininosuccinate lyase
MSKIWQTSGELDSLIEKFTVGDDYKVDQVLLPYDIVGSLAHAKMLAKISVLSKKEFSEIEE